METIQSKFWVFCEQRDGIVSEVGLELLGKAVKLAQQTDQRVAAVLMGEQLAPLCERLLSFGADEVLVADHPLLASYCDQSYAKVLGQAVRAHQPEVFLFGATAIGTNLASRLAAKLKTGLSAHCIDLGLSSEGELRAVVPGWGGNVLATIRCPHARPQMATVMPGVFPMPEEKKSRGEIIRLEVNVRAEDISYQILSVEKEEVARSSLENADVIVAGGWGIGSKGDWELLEELASVLKGSVGATRPPVDEGWARENQMIGQSGRTVHPKLYIGVAVSGQMHHMVGIKGAELIVAINQDPEAPVFDHCDMGLVGDFREILPPLIKALQNVRKNSRTTSRVIQ